MFVFIITSISFIKRGGVNNGENKVSVVAVNLQTLLECRGEKKSESLKYKNGTCNLRITFYERKPSNWNETNIQRCN